MPGPWSSPSAPQNTFSSLFPPFIILCSKDAKSALRPHWDKARLKPKSDLKQGRLILSICLSACLSMACYRPVVNAFTKYIIADAKQKSKTAEEKVQNAQGGPICVCDA
jgi:hypothetical protein